jgi:membrane protease YdiL (CAAX protease family)
VRDPEGESRGGRGISDAGRDRGERHDDSDPDGGLTAESFVRVGLFFYGAMAAVAVVWRTGVHGEDLLFASSAAAARGVHWLSDAALGVGLGLGVVGLSRLMTGLTKWGDRLGRGLAEALGPLSVPNALLLAVASGLAEEMFFRGALQPRIGWVAASLLFGVVHFVPRREFLPWTGFAIAMGFALGAIYEQTGNLVAPTLAHIVVNAMNLPHLVKRYGGAGRD